MKKINFLLTIGFLYACTTQETQTIIPTQVIPTSSTEILLTPILQSTATPEPTSTAAMPDYYKGFTGDLTQYTLVTDAELNKIISEAPAKLPADAIPPKIDKLLSNDDLVYPIFLTTDNVIASVKTIDSDGSVHNRLIVEVKNQDETISRLRIVFAGEEDRGYPAVDKLLGDGINSIRNITYTFTAWVQVYNNGPHAGSPISEFMTLQLQTQMEQYFLTGNVPKELEDLDLPVILVTGL